MKTKIKYIGQVYTVEFAGDPVSPSDNKRYGMRLWLVVDIYGPTHLIGAKHMEEAAEIYEDSLPEIPREEVKYAYGFDGQDEYDQWNNNLVYDSDDNRSLVEGYSYCSQATTTGIVSVSEYIRYVDFTPKFKK